MPNFTMHIFIGTVISIVLLFLIDRTTGLFIFENKWITILLFAAIVFIYSQLPDIDHQSSKVRFIFTAGGLAGALYCLVVLGHQNYAIIIISLLLFIWIMKWFGIFRHRGICHNGFAAVAFALPLIYFNWQTFIVGFASCFSHQVSDDIVTKMKRKKRKICN